MLISVLTPSLNQARFLNACLQSVEQQRYPHIEHIVCDGGSTDETLDILAASPSNVRWVSERDSGQAAAVNKAWRMSNGEVIAWINSDDLLFSSDTLERVARCFRASPSTDVVIGNGAIADQNGLILRHHVARWPVLPRLRSGSSPVVQPAMFIRRTAIEDLGYFLEESLTTTLDFDLVIRLALAGASVAHAGATLAVDRNQPDRKMTLLRDVYASEIEELATKHCLAFEETLLDRSYAWARRVQGVPEVLMWKRRYALVGDLNCDSTMRRLTRQACWSHERLLAANARGSRL
jgi:glycosyltransferase involved in cell wall biosynthesis